MEPEEIKEEDLLLRALRPGDADAVYRACQDPDIQRWTMVLVPYLPEHATDYATTLSRRAWADGSAAPFAVCDATTGEFLASCGLVSIDWVRHSAEIGYWTAPWARGRGVAVRATRAVARWAFTSLGLRRIIWQAEIGNHASRLVALRAGFTLAGRLRLAEPRPSADADAWVGSLLPADLDRPAGQVGAPGSLTARRAAVFGRAQPVLFAAAGGDQLRLRRLAEHDIDAIVDTCRDPRTIRWTTVPDPYRRWHAESFLTDFAHAAWALGTGAYFAIVDEHDDYVGSIDLRLSPADPLLADVGFMTAPHARGRGYMPAALRALCAWGFTALDLTRIEWRANVGNVASRRVAEKAGFVVEGTARGALDHRGVRTDAWVGALLPGDMQPRIGSVGPGGRA